MDDTKHLQWQVNIASGNGLVPSGNKPLPEVILTQIYVNTFDDKSTLVQTAYVDYMDLAVHCSRKAVKLNHSLTTLVQVLAWCRKQQAIT